MASAWGCSGTRRFWHDVVCAKRADGITVIAHDRRHHPLRRGRGLLRRVECRAGATVTLHVSCRADRYDVAIHRWGAGLELVWSEGDRAGIEHPTPADADSNGCGWPVGRHGADRRRLAQRLLPRHAHRPRRAAGSCRGVRRLRGPRRCAAGAGAAGARHEHVQRLQQLGRAQPVHRWPTGLVRPAVRARHADAAVDRARRSQVASDLPRRGTRRRRPDLPAVPVRQRLPRVHGLGRMVHLRTPLRRVGRGTGHPVRLRGVERSRDRPRHGRRLRPRPRCRSRRVLVGRSAGTQSKRTCGAAATTSACRATPCSGRSACTTVAARWSATSTAPTRPTRSWAPTRRRR